MYVTKEAMHRKLAASVHEVLSHEGDVIKSSVTPRMSAIVEERVSVKNEVSDVLLKKIIFEL